MSGNINKIIRNILALIIIFGFLMPTNLEWDLFGFQEKHALFMYIIGVLIGSALPDIHPIFGIILLVLMGLIAF